MPDYFNDELFTDDDRKMMLTLFYSILLLDNGDKTVRTNPEVFAKCVCEELDMKYVPIDNLEAVMRRIRRKLYSEVEFVSYFSVGDKLRVDIPTRYQVEEIKLEKDGKVLITVKSIGYNAKDKGETKVFDEETLYDLCCKRGDHQNEKVYLTRNVFILSGPSSTGKNAVFSMLQERVSNVKRAITVTTRPPRQGEEEGVDYYFISEDEFWRRNDRHEFAEQNFYDNTFYATPRSEIEKASKHEPIFLIIDTNGMDHIIRKYPLATSIFVMPPSMEELEKRMSQRGANSPDEMERRLKIAQQEIQRAKFYDFVITNDDVNQCVDQLVSIVQNKGFFCS